MTDARILVVEDENIVAMDIEARLRGLGYAVSAMARAGKEAVQLAEQTRPDLVLMDIGLEGEMDGVQAAGHIRDHLGIPVVYLTAYADEETLQRAKITEPFGYILKPLEDRDLRATIETALYKHQMEKRLRESEEQFRAMADFTYDWEYWIGVDGSYVYVSPSCERMTGYRADEFLQNPGLLEAIVHPDDRAAVGLHQREAFDNPQTSILDFRIITRAGEERWINHICQPVYGGDGRWLGRRASNRDITRRKRVEEALRESGHRFRSITETASDAIIIFDQNESILFWNPAAKAAFGYKGGETLGKLLESIISSPFSRVLRDEMQQIALAGKSGLVGKTMEMVGVRKDGSEFPVELSLAPWRTKEETYFTVIVRDITERKRAEGALRDKIRTLQTLAEIDHEIMAATGPQGILDLVCRRVAELLRVPKAAIAVAAEPGEMSMVSSHGLADSERARQEFARLWHAGVFRASQPGARGAVTMMSEIPADDPHMPEFRARENIQAHAGEPLTVGERTLGALVVFDTAPHAWSEDEIQILKLLAGRVAIALDKAQLFEETRAHAEQLTLLYDAGLALNSTLDPRAQLEILSQIAMKTLHGDRTEFFRYDAARGELQLELSIGHTGIIQEAPRELDSPTGSELGVAAWVSQSRTPLYLPDVTVHPHWTVVDPRIRSGLWVPVEHVHQLRGVLSVLSARVNAFAPQDERLLELFANQAAVALENADLFEAERQQRELAETLRQVGATLAATLDVDAVLDRLLDQVSRVVPNDVANVMLIEGDRFRIARRRGYERFGPETQDATIAYPIAGLPNLLEMIETGKPIVVSNTLQDPNWIHRPETEWPPSYAGAPIQARGTTIGLLNVGSSTPDFFTAEHAERLRAFADQAAIALENARLFEAERTGRRRLETLYRIGQTINSMLDASAILDRLTDEAMHATRATHGSAIVARPDLDCFERRSLRGYSSEQAEKARSLPLPLDRGLNGRAYQTHQAIYLADTRTDPNYFPLIPDTRSELVVPIIRGGQVLGNLDLQSPEVDAFRDVDMGFLQALTDQVAIALENARLFAETRRRLDEMATVSNVALVGAAGRPFDETVARATDALLRLWPDANSLGFLFVDEADQSLYLHPSYYDVSPASIGHVRIPLDQGITGWVARERQPVRVADVTRDPRYVIKTSRGRSEMAAPLVVGGRATGVVNVESPLPDAFSGDDLRLLATLTGQLATILEKARLDAELAEYTARLEQRVEERTAEIRRQQARTQAILDALGEGVVVTDADGAIQYINPATETLTGYHASEVAGQNPRLWQSKQTPLPVYQEMWNTILSGLTWRGEIVNRRKDGALYDAELTIAPVPGESPESRSAGFVGVQRDITERKQAEEGIRKALAKEMELGELKSRFVTMTSHEFRTPLSTILSSAELLEHYGPKWTEEKRLVHVHRIETAVQNMIQLLDDVLVIGRAEAGRLEFNPAPLELVQFCGDLVEEMQLGAGPQHAIHLVARGECIHARMDEKLLRQILGNLLSNAIKYSPQGGPVHFELDCQAGHVIFRVRDQGIGIPPEDQARLFETFHRAKNVGNIPGTGLGLPIVKKSVNLHGGTIAVDSQVGVGTTVTVTLPMESGG